VTRSSFARAYASACLASAMLAAAWTAGVAPVQAYPFDPNSAHDQYVFARQIWRTGEAEACQTPTLRLAIEGMQKQLAWFNNLINEVSSILGNDPDHRTSDSLVNARLDQLQEELPTLQNERAVIAKWLSILTGKPPCFEFPKTAAQSTRNDSDPGSPRRRRPPQPPVAQPSTPSVENPPHSSNFH